MRLFSRGFAPPVLFATLIAGGLAYGVTVLFEVPIVKQIVT
jgi:hypothetical protein